MRGEAITRDIIDWLLGSGRELNDLEVVGQFCQRLVAANVPLYRLTTHINQISPLLFGRGIYWLATTGKAEEVSRALGVEDTDLYHESPVALAFDGLAELRRQIEDPDIELDFPILQELKTQGVTDYVMMRMPFRGGQKAAIGFSSQRSGGFSEADLTVIRTVLPAFSTVLDFLNLERKTETLLDTYVGHAAGRRVLDGEIHRGTGETIHAVLWFADLRGFTELTNTLPPDQVIALLNEFFERLATPVEAAGGEILKFIGDAMLAIFPIKGDGAAIHLACAAALGAAEEAIAGIRKLNNERNAAKQRPLEFRLALHIGDALYGNIGAENRLDFTVIGRDVNLVVRLVQACASEEHHFVVSSAFASFSQNSMVRLGEYTLRGFAEPQEAFAPEHNA